MADPIWPLLCTLSLLIGWLAGNRERRGDDEVICACAWDDAVTSALFVARPSEEDYRGNR